MRETTTNDPASAPRVAPGGEPEKCERCGWKHPGVTCRVYAHRKSIAWWFAAYHHAELIEAFLASYDGPDDHDAIRDAFRPLLPSVTALDARLATAERERDEAQREAATQRNHVIGYRGVIEILGAGLTEAEASRARAEQALTVRLDVCKTRMDAADRRFKQSGNIGDKLNSYYHGGEVAALTFALALRTGGTPATPEPGP